MNHPKDNRQHEIIATTIRFERRFWHVVVVLTAIFGIILGAGLVRCEVDQTPDAVIDVAATRVIQLKAKVADLKATLNRCNWALFAEIKLGSKRHDYEFEPDFLSGPCAVSWEHLARSTPGWLFVNNRRRTRFWLVKWEKSYVDTPGE